MSMNRNLEKEDILIVDDKPANLRLLSQMLRDEGYEVRAVTSGSRALNSIQLQKPNLILLDIKMAEMDGYQVCETLKNDPDTKEIPIIFVTAKIEVSDETHGLELGAVDYIHKPFHAAIILARIQSQMIILQQRRELRQQIDLAHRRRG